MHDRASLALAALMMVCSGGAVYLAGAWPWKAALFPMAIGIPVFCLAAAELAWGLFRPAESERARDFQMSDGVPPATAARRAALAAAWMLGFFAAIALIGFPVAVPLFVLLYLKLQGRESWVLSIVFSASVWAFFHLVFERLLNLPFPSGWIQGWIGG
jgi:hypothetical protein